MAKFEMGLLLTTNLDAKKNQLTITDLTDWFILTTNRVERGAGSRGGPWGAARQEYGVEGDSAGGSAKRFS
ncbi:hypothetical protein [Paenibacillus sp. 1001270B_150601_E10]|uniref:hypothetical protein n=1 Tax=Paenibacillus sp. 1001270B_150601_E10 TaxID=2787079 RepID=UPI0018A06C7B|nr:hypothetical protein [Paenibacillus sp. 1001270B_150601_E10]